MQPPGIILLILMWHSFV